MKISKKKILIFSLIICLLFVVIESISVLNNKKIKPSIYLGIGDSLALGISPDGSSNKSYIDFLGPMLKSNKLVENYSKDFTRSNMKSAELLKIVEKDAISTQQNQSIKFSQLIKKTKILTISVGLSDFISEFKYTPITRELTFDSEAINNKLMIVQHNLYEAIEEIKNYNLDIQIYLIGYYFLFPWISAQARANYQPIFNQIKEVYQEIASDSQVNFVDISTIGDQQYLPSILSYFPNQDGYETIASIIKKEIYKSLKL